MTVVTKEHLLELWRRDMDPGYVVPLEDENGGAGFDVIDAMATVLARAAEAGRNSAQALFLLPHRIQTAPPASGPIVATGTVQVYRGIVIGGGLPLDDGDPIVAHRLGVDGEDEDSPTFEIVGDITIPAGTEGPTTVNVRCSRPGFAGNVPAGTEGRFPRKRGGSFSIVSFVPGTGVVTVDAALGDRFTPEMTGMWWRFLDGPNIGVPARRVFFQTATTAQIDNAAALTAQGAGGTADVVDIDTVAALRVVFDGTSGGRSGELDTLAVEAGASGRAVGEDDDALRARAVDTPEALTPNAIVRALGHVLDPIDIPFDFIEVFEEDAGFFFSGAVVTDDAFGDPYAYRRRSFFVGARPGMVPIGFLVVINGLAVPPEPDRTRILSAVTTAIVKLKGPGVPWAIAFEPPIPL